MSREHFGAVATPVYRTSTILYPDIETLASQNVPYKYGRLGTPTSQSFETAVAELEGAARSFALPSGLNAIATAILAVCGAGDHLLMIDTCYGPGRSFCDGPAKRLGIETEYYAPSHGADIASLIRPNTKAIYCESPGSLTFEVQDIPAIAAAAHARGVTVLMDNTWATPLFFRPFEHGVDLSIQAATKYIAGHSDVMIGVVSANADHVGRVETFVHDLGLSASGDDCFLALRGLRTLPVRLARHRENALKLARWLQMRPEVERVLYPALPDDPGHAIWRRDFTGACGLFGAVLKPAAKTQMTAFFNGFAHFGLGFSWGGYESLIIPARFTRTVGDFAAAGPVIRIHAGLEDADDLIDDLAAGFARMKEA